MTGQPTYYLDDGDRPVEEVVADSEDLFYSVFGASGLEGRSREYAAAGGDPTQIAYSAYTYDPQGSLVQPVSLYPDNGPVVRVDTSSAYDAFGWGVTVAAAGQADYYSPVGFGGQWGYYRDYTGLYLLTHRYYDAGAGRFVSRDPIGYKGGINLYGFAGNNPVNESDPDGTSVASFLLKQGAKAVLKHELKRYIEEQILRRLVSIGSHKIKDDVLKEANDIISLTDSDTVFDVAIGLIPYVGDAYDFAKFGVNTVRAIQRTDRLVERVNGLLARRQISVKVYGNMKKVEDAVQRSGGIFQRRVRGKLRTAKPEMDERGMHLHDQDHDDLGRPNVHWRP